MKSAADNGMFSCNKILFKVQISTPSIHLIKPVNDLEMDDIFKMADNSGKEMSFLYNRFTYN